MRDTASAGRTGAMVAAGLLAWHWLPWYPSVLVALVVTFTIAAVQGSCPAHSE